MKLAIISLSTFGYFERLSESISRRGIATKFFDERPANDVVSKLKYRVLPRKIGQQMARHHTRSICEQIVAEGFTHVLVFFLEVLSRSDIEYLKTHGLQISRYTWDSVRNRPNILQFDDLMEAVGSFDPDDCEKYGYTYIPLYSEIIEENQVRPMKVREFDFYFCGTMHSSRPTLIYDIEKISQRREWRIKLKLFYYSHWLYVVQNLMNRKAMRLRHQISSAPFAHNAILTDSQLSRVVIDIHHPGQNGLTMRTYEALAQGAILATTNHNALKFLGSEFPGRVATLDLENLEFSLEQALKHQPPPLTEAQYYTLSQERFIDQILTVAGLN